MSDEDTAYYIAKGASLAAIIDYIELRKATKKRYDAFAEKFGATGCALRRGPYGDIAVIGLNFDSPPEGWKQPKVKGVTRPHFVPTSRKINREMESLPVLLPCEAGTTLTSLTRGIVTPDFELLGTDYIISQHEKAKAPPDAIPMKRSEYWAKREGGVAK